MLARRVAFIVNSSNERGIAVSKPLIRYETWSFRNSEDDLESLCKELLKWHDC